MSEHKRERRKKTRTAQIVEMTDTSEYKSAQKEKTLKDENEALEDVVRLQNKTYKSPDINKQAEILKASITVINTRLAEQLRAIDLEISLKAGEKNTDQRIILLEKRKMLLNATINKLSVEHQNLSAIEDELYPALKSEHGAVFLQNKHAAAELYVSLKNRVGTTRFLLQEEEESLKEEDKTALKEDLQILEQQLLQEINAITNKTVEIDKQVKGGVISNELYAEMANQIYELSEKKFEVEQRCKLIEDKLVIVKLDKKITEETARLQQQYEDLTPLFGIVFMAASGQARYGDLSTSLKKLVMDDKSRPRLNFSAEDYQPQIAISSMQWNDDRITREVIKAERQKLIDELTQKKENIDEVITVITTHQRLLKDAIGVKDGISDLEYCARRAGLHDAFTNNQRGSFTTYTSTKKSLEYDFQSGMDSPEYQSAVRDLLSYGFESASPNDCRLIQTLKSTRQSLEESQKKFDTEYKDLALHTENGTFTYKNEVFPQSETITTAINNYVLAKTRINEAFKNGDAKVSYANHIDYKQELAMLKESKTVIEQYIANYKENQSKISEKISQNIGALRHNFKRLAPFNLQDGLVKHNDKSYVLKPTISAEITNYNRKHKELAQEFESKNLIRNEQTYEDLKNKFNTLQELGKKINESLELQRKTEEQHALITKLEKQLLDVTKKINVVSHIGKKITDEMKEMEQNSSEDDPKLVLLSGLKEQFAAHQARLTTLEKSIRTAREESTVNNLEHTTEVLQELKGTNETSTKELTKELKQEFDAKLPGLSADYSTFNQIMEWLDKHIIEPLYNSFSSTPKTYKPGFYAAPIEKSLHAFRNEILPELESTQLSPTIPEA